MGYLDFLGKATGKRATHALGRLATTYLEAPFSAVMTEIAETFPVLGGKQQLGGTSLGSLVRTGRLFGTL